MNQINCVWHIFLFFAGSVYTATTKPPTARPEPPLPPTTVPYDATLAPVVISRPAGELRIVKTWPQGKRKALAMSYDDGTVIPDKKVIEVFNRYGIKATFFLNSLHPLTQDALKDPAAYQGHEVASHGAKHLSFEDHSIDECRHDVATDQQILGKLFGYPINGFAYAYGGLPRRSKDRLASEEMLKALHIRYGRLARYGDFSVPKNLLLWSPTCGDHDVVRFGRLYINMPTSDTIVLMSIWGHSRTLYDRDGWATTEQFCKMVAENQSIWSATFLQVADYVLALRSLKISDKQIHNESTQTLWLRINGQLRQLPPGQILELDSVGR